MLIITEQAKQFIKTNFNNSEELLQVKQLNDILEPMYELILEKGFDGEDYNDFGREAQKIYDSIYERNVPLDRLIDIHS